MDSQYLIVGDVQGDWERLNEALAPYAPEVFSTIFLGDFFQGGKVGDMGGVRSARIARERPHSKVVLGNHEVFILGVLELLQGIPLPSTFADEPSMGARFREYLAEKDGFIRFWEFRRGDWADVRALQDDPDLEQWIRSCPIMIQLEDGTLVQHTDTDEYLKYGSTLAEVNAWARSCLEHEGGVFDLLPIISKRHAFDDLVRTEKYLEAFQATRVVHGHTPCGNGNMPTVRWNGAALCYDGKFSRYWRRSDDEAEAGPIEATVGLLPLLKTL